jgi:hypothetical protein
MKEEADKTFQTLCVIAEWQFGYFLKKKLPKEMNI